MLVLKPGHRDRLSAWISDAYPAEACGLLVGSRAGGRAEVVEVRSARNMRSEERDDRYELDPADFVAADCAARSAGLEVLGIWHSHPDSPAVPSETDRAAAWEGWSYLIVAAGPDGARDLRSWRLSGERFCEEVVEGSSAVGAEVPVP